MTLGGCPGSRATAPENAAPDRATAALDRLIRRGDVPRTIDEFRACLGRIDAMGICRPEERPLSDRTKESRVVPIRLALDPRYATEWAEWETRLASTLQCVNRLYEPTGISWRLASIDRWDPGNLRHRLYPLLARLQRDFPPDRSSVMLGMVLWDEAQVYRKAGGEIGLSQGSACVVPSWPRIENDCVILAHELGHLIGARHVPGKKWLMGWSARPFFLPAANPLARVTAIYRFHPVNVALIATHQTARFTPYGLRPTGDCRRRAHLIQRCWWGKR